VAAGLRAAGRCEAKGADDCASSGADSTARLLLSLVWHITRAVTAASLATAMALGSVGVSAVLALGWGCRCGTEPGG
jgi:hypothetical protein